MKKLLFKQESIYAFLVFTPLFILTVALIIISIFFNYQLPWKQNDQLRKENAAIISEYKYQERLENQMELLRKYLDSIDLPNKKYTYYYQQKAIDIVRNIDKNIPSQDSVRRRLLYKNFVLTAQALIASKKAIMSKGNTKSEVDTLEANIKYQLRQINQLKRELIICRELSQSR